MVLARIHGYVYMMLAKRASSSSDEWQRCKTTACVSNDTEEPEERHVRKREGKTACEITLVELHVKGCRKGRGAGCSRSKVGIIRSRWWRVLVYTDGVHATWER